LPNAKIQLKNPIEGHVPDATGTGTVLGAITEIELREPRYRDVMTLGEPAAYARSDGGLIYTAEKDDVVQAYVERLLVSPKDPALLTQLSLADALQLKEAVFGFFTEARRAISPPS
jgi:hypothetical protein